MSRRTRIPVAQTEIFPGADPAWVIYALCDPRVDDSIKRIRYVGVTSRHVSKRLAEHLREARSKKRSYKCNWLRGLLAASLVPAIEVIDSACCDREWFTAEKKWIEHFRSIGCPLTNTTDGGRGVVGLEPSVRVKLSAVHRARMADPAMRARIAEAVRQTWENNEERRAAQSDRAKKWWSSASEEDKRRLADASRDRVPTEEEHVRRSLAARNRSCSAETRTKHSERMKARMADPEFKAKALRAIIGRAVSEETRGKLAEAQTGRTASPEAKAKMSEARRRLWSDPEYRKKMAARGRQ